MDDAQVLADYRVQAVRLLYTLGKPSILEMMPLTCCVPGSSTSGKVGGKGVAVSLPFKTA